LRQQTDDLAVDAVSRLQAIFMKADKGTRGSVLVDQACIVFWRNMKKTEKTVFYRHSGNK
jgi:hypothetical protein